MVDVAKEMKRRKLNIPLLIGGATTSKMHTAVKIAPQYSSPDHPVIHVLDASKSVVVASSLLDSHKKEDYVEDIMELYDDLREDFYAGLDERTFISFDKAREQKLQIDFDSQPPVPVARPGVQVEVGRSIEDVIPYIDWSPFFQLWQLRGKYPNRGYPKIFKDETVGEEARKVFDHAQAMLKEITQNKLLELRVSSLCTVSQFR